MGRALGGAVQRNRMKRRLREAVRLSRPVAGVAADVVINPKKSLLTADFADVLNEVRRAFAVIEQKLSGKVAPAAELKSARPEAENRILRQCAKFVTLQLLRAYKWAISPMFPPACRYVPTCSEYAMEAVERYGALRGGWMALGRVLRCHPVCPGRLRPGGASGEGRRVPGEVRRMRTKNLRR